MINTSLLSGLKVIHFCLDLYTQWIVLLPLFPSCVTSRVTRKKTLRKRVAAQTCPFVHFSILGFRSAIFSLGRWTKRRKTTCCLRPLWKQSIFSDLLALFVRASWLKMAQSLKGLIKPFSYGIFLFCTNTIGRHKYYEHVKSYKLAFSQDGITWSFVKISGEDKVRNKLTVYFLLRRPASSPTLNI